MIAIIDCNSFYCSCERLFRPELDNKPVVVLSNNDGCIIARSDEAKTLNLPMGAPYFKAKAIIKANNVFTFSSNYNLYGDLSWRVMETLRQLVGVQNVEVYSVDEAFLNLDFVEKKELKAVATSIKETVELWTGIKVSIGVAPTKVLAKVANKLSKKNKIITNCVLVLDSPRKIEQALQKTNVEDVWGVGFQYAEKLKKLHIHTAFDLSIKDVAWAHKNLGGVVGARLLRELKGIASNPMQEQLTSKKMIATTRMFGEPITQLKDIKEAIATHTTRAAEKLRRQHSAAKTISIFLIAKNTDSSNFSRGITSQTYMNLPMATANTNELIKPALQLVESIFKAGSIYKKSGVILSNIVPNTSIQGNLFLTQTENKQKLLMDVIDNVNFSQRNDLLRFASSGSARNWRMQQNHLSPKYTTRWEELCVVK